HRVSVAVLGDERVVARGLQVLRELVEHEVPRLLFPPRAARRAIEGFRDAPGARRELHRRRPFRAEAALVDRAVGVALDLQQLRLAVGSLLRVRDERAADRAVRAQRTDFLGARDAERELALFRKTQVEAERVGKRCECGGTGAGGAELEELTTGEVAHVLSRVLFQASVCVKLYARYRRPIWLRHAGVTRPHP